MSSSSSIPLAPLVLFLLCTTCLRAQEPIVVAAVKTESSTANQNLYDLKFSLAPLTLNIPNELEEARQHYEAQAWQKAIDAASRFLREYPEHKEVASAYFIRGEAHAQLRQYEETTQNFRKLLSHHPTDEQRKRAEFRLAEAAMLVGDDTEAERRLKVFRNRYPDEPLNAYVLVYLGQIVGRSDSKAAKAIFVDALQRFPGGPLHRLARLHLGLIQYGEEEWQQAYDEFRELIETGLRSDPDFWTAWYWRAHAELKLQRDNEAVNRLDILSKEQPNHELAAAALFYAAEAYQRRGENSLALKRLDRLRDNYPASVYTDSAMVAQMQIYRMQGQYEEALDLNRLISSAADKLTRIKAKQIVAEIFIVQGNYSRAAELIEPFSYSPANLSTTEQRDAYYTNLYLEALLQRARGRHPVARELLGRVRLDRVSSELAERIALARMQTWFASGELELISDAATRFFNDYPDSRLTPTVVGLTIRTLVKQKKYSEAWQQLQRLSNEKESAPLRHAAEVVAEDAYAREDFALARSAFELLKRAHPAEQSLARALTGLAWIAKRESRFEEAALYYQEFLDRFPDDVDVWKVRLAYAETLAELTRVEEARETLEPFEQLPLDHSDRVRGLYQLALLGKENAQWQQESTRIADALLQDYDDFELRDAVLYLTGLLHLRNGDNDTSKQAFSDLADSYPQSRYWSDAVYRLAELAHTEQDTLRAKRHLTKVISVERDSDVLAHALFLQGRIASEEKNWAEARSTLRKLLREYPDSKLRDVARYGIAESYFQQKDFERATQLFEILENEKRFGLQDNWGAMVKLRNAQLAVHRKQLARALQAAADIETQYPDFSLQHEVDYLIGRVHAARGEFSNAREAYRRVVADDPEFDREITAMAQWMAGETYFHQKRYDQAIDTYSELIEDLQYDNWQAASHLQIGKCYELLDNFDLAKASYSRVTTRYPDSKWSEEAEYRLNQVALAE